MKLQFKVQEYQTDRRCRIPAFVALQKRIVKHRPAIDAALDSGLSNALVESTNTKIRLITRVAFGFHGPEPLIALAMLSLGSHPPALPGRNCPTDQSGGPTLGVSRRSELAPPGPVVVALPRCPR